MPNPVPREHSFARTFRWAYALHRNRLGGRALPAPINDQLPRDVISAPVNWLAISAWQAIKVLSLLVRRNETVDDQ